MTSKLNREQLRARAVKKIESLNFAITQSAFTNIRLSLEEELQLAEFALAAMDGEPVAYMTYKGYLLHAGDPKLAEYSEPMPLYADPRPAPTSAEPVAYAVRRDSGDLLYPAECRKQAEWQASNLEGATFVPLYRHAQPAKGLELAGWQFKSVNGDWLGLIDEHGKNQAVREGCEVREVFAMVDGVNERDQVRREHAEWSQATFGDVGPVGPLKHLSKEALEAAAEPGDLSEWADMQFLLWDAQRRAGITDEQITQAMIEKLAVNKQREWPAPKDGEPRLHIKEQPAPVVPKDVMPGGLVYSSALPKFESNDSDKVVGYCCFISGETRIVEIQEQAYADAKAVLNAFRAAMLQSASVCTCPSGDGSLRWPCPSHPGNSPVIPEGYVMVPKEPTERMVIDGFESEPDETFSEPEVWEAYQKMSGCEQAAFRARLCWAAMIAAAL